MKFSASVVALAAAVLAANAAPASDPPNKNLGGDNVNQNACGGDQVIRDSNNEAKQGGLLSGLGLTRRQNNKNLGGDGVNQNCGGDQVIRDSNNEETDDGLLSGVVGGLGLAKRNGGYYYVPTNNHNKNLGGDGVNQNTGGDQVVRDSNNEATQGGLLDGLGLGGVLSKRSGGYYYIPTVNQNDNLGGDATNQNSGGDQVVRDSNNDVTDDSLLGGLGLDGLLSKRGYYYVPTSNNNKNLGGDGVNQNSGGDQVVRDSNSESTDDGLLSGLLSKRNAGYYYFPTVNDNQNNGGDGVNQNNGGDQVVRDSNSESTDDGLLSGLLSKRGGYYYFPTVNDNQNNGGDAVNQNGGGDQVVRDSNNAAEQGGLLSGLGLAKRTQKKAPAGYYYFPTVNTNKNLGGDGVNQNTGGDQVVRDSNNKAEQGGLLSGLGL